MQLVSVIVCNINITRNFQKTLYIFECLVLIKVRLLLVDVYAGVGEEVWDGGGAKGGGEAAALLPRPEGTLEDALVAPAGAAVPHLGPGRQFLRSNSQAVRADQYENVIIALHTA